MEWYQTININQRINAKECFELLCGVEWQKAGRLLDMRTRIELFHQKLRIEGFKV